MYGEFVGEWACPSRNIIAIIKNKVDRLKTLRKSITTMQREGQAPRPTKSEWDSAVLEGYAGRRVVVQSLRLDGKKFAT